MTETEKIKITIHLEVDSKTSPDAEIIGIKEDFANYCEKFGDVRMVEVEEDSEEKAEAIKNAIAKQTPAKVNERLDFSRFHSSYNCPNCGCYFGVKQFMDLPFDSPGSESYKKKSHCCNCGQKLDWSDKK